MPISNIITINNALTSLLASAIAKAKGGLTPAEAKALAFEFINTAMVLVKPEFVDGQAKKEFVLQWVTTFYDQLAPFVEFIPLPVWLAWIKPVLAMLGFNKDWVRAQVLSEASVLIEFIYGKWIAPTPNLPINA